MWSGTLNHKKTQIRLSRLGMAWISTLVRSGSTGSWEQAGMAVRLPSVSSQSTAWRPALRTDRSWCGRAKRLWETTLYPSGKIWNRCAFLLIGTEWILQVLVGGLRNDSCPMLFGYNLTEELIRNFI